VEQQLTFGPFLTECVFLDWGSKVFYRAVHLPTGTAVALSVYRGDTERHLFGPLCDFLKKIQHRNLPQYMGHGEQGGCPYVATQFIDGIPLDLLIRRQGKLAGDAAIGILLQLADALSYLHAIPFTHPGLGADVILVDDAGAVTVFGFGSLVFRSDYTPPEQTGRTGPTRESNIFSLGVIAYEVLTGRLPFEQTGWAGAVENMPRSPIPIREEAPDLPTGISELVEQMLAVSPASRPTAVEVVRRLEAESTAWARWRS
jgi:serine/threonine protein kinase